VFSGTGYQYLSRKIIKTEGSDLLVSNCRYDNIKWLRLKMTLEDFVNEIRQHPNSDNWKIKICDGTLKISNILKKEAILVAKQFCLFDLAIGTTLIADYGIVIIKITKTD